MNTKYFSFTDPNSHILATGGATKNHEILQVLSNVFNTPVYTIPVTANSACLGCIYRAMYGWSGTKVAKFNDIFKAAPEYKLAVIPDETTKEVYEEMLKRYERLEQLIATQN